MLATGLTPVLPLLSAGGRAGELGQPAHLRSRRRYRPDPRASPYGPRLLDRQRDDASADRAAAGSAARNNLELGGDAESRALSPARRLSTPQGHGPASGRACSETPEQPPTQVASSRAFAQAQ